MSMGGGDHHLQSGNPHARLPPYLVKESNYVTDNKAIENHIPYT